MAPQANRPAGLETGVLGRTRGNACEVDAEYHTNGPGDRVSGSSDVIEATRPRRAQTPDPRILKHADTATDESDRSRILRSVGPGPTTLWARGDLNPHVLTDTGT